MEGGDMKRFAVIYVISLSLVILFAVGWKAFLNSGFTLNSPANHEVVNEVGETLAIGEEWKEGDLLTLRVQSVDERAWSEPEFALEKYDAFRLQHYRIYDVCFEYEALNYSGYDDRGQQQRGLFFDVFAIGCDEHHEKVQPIPLDAHTTGLFRENDQGEASGMKSTDNHYIVFAKPEVSAIEIHFATYINDTEHTLEKNFGFICR